MPLLELRDVSKAFGGLQVIDHLSLHVVEGEIVSVIGPNGAGKTTLFNLITGVYRPTTGDILLDGESLVGLAPHVIAKRGVGRTFQTLRLFLNMTVKENVMVPTWAHTRSGVFSSVFRTPRMRRSWSRPICAPSTCPSRCAPACSPQPPPGRRAPSRRPHPAPV